ncbi:MAG: formate dehydrogenase accessory protein FdhE [Saezia sp.]
MGQKKIINVTPETTEPSRAPLLQDDLRLLYSNRSQRLRSLAKDHAIQDYLLFAADIVDVQSSLLKKQHLGIVKAKDLVVDWQTAPLLKTADLRDPYWLTILNALLDQLGALPQYKKNPIAKAIKRIRNWKDSTKEKKASQLLAGEFEAVGSDTAIFLWAALSLYWAQLARQHKLIPHENIGVKRHICPVCGSEPVASVILTGNSEGLRYLHCNLCETKWHYVRALCSNCEDGSKIYYWTLDDTESPVKAESCGHCQSHLKIIYQNKDVKLEPVADDLASLALDALMEEEGFSRSAINPFLFPASPSE